MFVKICGLTEEEGVLAAAAAGADAVGFVFAPSPRRITARRAQILGALLPPSVQKVGVFVSPDPVDLEATMDEASLDLVQIHGVFPEETYRRLGLRAIRGVRVGRDEPSPALVAGNPRFLLLDTYLPGRQGGSGQAFPWAQTAAYRGLNTPLLIAGGLTPDNVRAALDAAKPDGVDVSSGVENAPGRKDPAKIAAFVQAVREWHYRNHEL